MQQPLLFILALWVSTSALFSQEKAATSYYAGFKTIHLVDSTRVFKPDTDAADSLHYRPVDLDIWYPATTKSGLRLKFDNLIRLHEKRANRYQEVDYTGMTEELATYLTVGFGLEVQDGKRLLEVETNSYQDAEPASGSFPIILYMAGYNGMGWENYRILEKLAENGFVVVSVWSVGRYPGDMSNDILDTMEQVYDGEFAMKWMSKEDSTTSDYDSVGVLGCSWGGMSGAILLDRHPEIKAMATLDGSETHYFGDTEEDDSLLTEIYEAGVLHPEAVSVAYLFMESDNKWDEFTPTGEYHYYKKLNSTKHYLRFLGSEHEDFGSIAWTLKISEFRTGLYEQIGNCALLFFEENLKSKQGFQKYKTELLDSNVVTDQPYDYDPTPTGAVVLKGSIRDAKTDEVLPYVNIGLINGEQGTVSNRDGLFNLSLLEENLSDTLRISMVGYEAKTYPVKDLVKDAGDLNIVLKEEIAELNEVVVTAKEWKYKKLGNTTKSKFIGTGFAYDQLGTELGIKINLRKKPTFVNSFNFTISHNRLSAKILFRLNMYQVERGKPTENILRENIIIPIEAKQTGTIEVDLKEYDIVLLDDVVVTLEWIANEGEVKTGEALFFPLGFFTDGTYVKYSSQGKLKRKRGMGIGFYLDVKY